MTMIRRLRNHADLIAALNRERIRQGLSISEVARRLNCKIQNMSRWFNPDSRIGMHVYTIFRLADALDLDLALVPRDETAPPAALRATESAQQPLAQGADGNGPETGTAGATDERAREDT
jgi:transcriptional regulator with XRE-family HTH domain